MCYTRDLHDLIGYSLSAIMLKAELASRIAADQLSRAKDEIRGVVDTARQALSDVRAVSHGCGPISLSNELSLVASLLTATGVDAHAEISYGALSEAAGSPRPSGAGARRLADTVAVSSNQRFPLLVVRFNLSSPLTSRNRAAMLSSPVLCRSSRVPCGMPSFATRSQIVRLAVWVTVIKQCLAVAGRVARMKSAFELGGWA